MGVWGGGEPTFSLGQYLLMFGAALVIVVVFLMIRA
jgi:hypothetical protein